LTKKVYEELQDENYHLLNEFLTRNGYFNEKLTEELLKGYNNPNYSGAYADKDSITIGQSKTTTPIVRTNLKGKKLSSTTTYIPNRDIAEVVLKNGKKISGSNIADGVYELK
jgi:hypothetical protein